MRSEGKRLKRTEVLDGRDFLPMLPQEGHLCTEDEDHEVLGTPHRCGACGHTAPCTGPPREPARA